MHVAFALVFLAALASSSSDKARVGSLSSLAYGVGGEVFLLDDRRILIKGFSYSGKVLLKGDEPCFPPSFFCKKKVRIDYLYLDFACIC